MKKTIILDLDVSFSHIKFQVSKMKRSEVTAVSADDVFAAIFFSDCHIGRSSPNSAQHMEFGQFYRSYIYGV